MPELLLQATPSTVPATNFGVVDWAIVVVAALALFGIMVLVVGAGAIRDVREMFRELSSGSADDASDGGFRTPRDRGAGDT